MPDQPTPRQRWAQFRFAVIGPLLAAPPPAGELQSALAELAGQTWQHPIDGTPVTFGFSTIERWYHAAKAADRDPVAALRPQRRRDAGHSRQLSAALVDALREQYAAHRNWSVHYRRKVIMRSYGPNLAREQ